MRSCLVLLVAAILFVAVVLWVALPISAGFVVRAGLQGSGFSGSGTNVGVSASPPYELLAGHADAVRVRSTDASLGGVHATAVDLTFGDVDLFSRTFGTIQGTLSGVAIKAPDGTVAVASSVILDGPATTTQATLLIPTDQADALATARLRTVTGLAGQVRLAPPDGVTLSIPGAALTGRLVVRQGSLVLVPDGPGLPAVAVVSPGSDNPFTLTGVSVASDGLHLIGTIDAAALIH